MIIFGKWKISKEELNSELEQDRTDGNKDEIYATMVSFGEESKKVIIRLSTGQVIDIDSWKIQGLENATLIQLKNVSLQANGRAIRWKDLDVDMGVEGLVNGVYGTKAWMSNLLIKALQNKKSKVQ